MMKRLKSLRLLRNKVVLITGGSSGIGEQLALEAARRGAIVVVCSRHQDKLEEVAHKCLILSGRPLVYLYHRFRWEVECSMRARFLLDT